MSRKLILPAIILSSLGLILSTARAAAAEEYKTEILENKKTVEISKNRRKKKKLISFKLAIKPKRHYSINENSKNIERLIKKDVVISENGKIALEITSTNPYATKAIQDFYSKTFAKTPDFAIGVKIEIENISGGIRVSIYMPDNNFGCNYDSVDKVCPENKKQLQIY